MDSTSEARPILLIEDELMVAGMLRRMLTELGYAVVGTATTVDEAMEMIEGGGIEAVILDINLDGEMSYPVADELIRRGIPFLFSTGYGGADMPDNYQGSHVLKKPFRRSTLGDALAGLLEASQSESEHGSGKARRSISVAR